MYRSSLELSTLPPRNGEGISHFSGCLTTPHQTSYSNTMPAHRTKPAPRFDSAFDQARGYQISTPYGVVTIGEEGRRITFQLYPDVRESIHHKALFSYVQQLKKRGVIQLNIDHLDLAGLDRSIDLRRGKSILDLVYIHRGELHEVELKTHREVGLDVTAKQLTELVRYCQKLTVVVPRRDMENMQTIATMLDIDKRITIDTYELLEEEGEENNDN